MASKIEREKTGASKLIIEEIKSTEPYSCVDKTSVYNGIRKKTINLEVRFPNPK
jgi:hypothetical protein